ncbi:N-formylglutamate amidohydrolase [Alkalicoccus chagannorensis]|uniref:N-formylglutamate amidohydrolase n=1 Tax=Alkalicoccus chagannorensis TaxID=427072 RepID=UPI0003F93BFB|nr:N-formylglutamate amidohydrolase [Alkalicoccus chagannorensis]
MTNEQERLPLLISVPHGGVDIPEELRARSLLTDVDVALDGDTWTKQLFDFEQEAAVYLAQDTARIVVDLNRDPMDRPPENPDGVVKTKTVLGSAVWSEALTETETNQLIQAFHEPYHAALVEASAAAGLVAAVDCHTMLADGPDKNTGGWSARPLICISNRGLPDGAAGTEPVTAPAEMMEQLRLLLEEVFADEADGTVPLVAVNTPFLGGYITQSHGRRSDLPWIQLELNRKLYLPAEPKAVPDDADLARLEVLNRKLYDVFSRFAAQAVPAPDERRTIS